MYLVSLSGAAEAAESQMGRLDIRPQRQKGPKISRRPITTCPEAEGEPLHCSPLPPPPTFTPPLFVRRINSKPLVPGVCLDVRRHTHQLGRLCQTQAGGQRQRHSANMDRSGEDPPLASLNTLIGQLDQG